MQGECAFAFTGKVHNKRQVGMFEAGAHQNKEQARCGWATLNSTSFMASGELMTKETLGSSEAFPTVHPSPRGPPPPLPTRPLA